MTAITASLTCVQDASMQRCYNVKEFHKDSWADKYNLLKAYARKGEKERCSWAFIISRADNGQIDQETYLDICETARIFNPVRGIFKRTEFCHHDVPGIVVIYEVAGCKCPVGFLIKLYKAPARLRDRHCIVYTSASYIDEVELSCVSVLIVFYDNIEDDDAVKIIRVENDSFDLCLKRLNYSAFTSTKQHKIVQQYFQPQQQQQQQLLNCEYNQLGK